MNPNDLSNNPTPKPLGPAPAPGLPVTPTAPVAPALAVSTPDPFGPPGGTPPVSGTDASRYLNQLSGAPAGGGKFLNKKMLIILGAVGAAIITAIIVIASSSGGGTDIKQQLAAATQKYENVLSILDYGSKNLSASSVSRVNATAALVVATQNSKISGLNGKTKLSKENSAKIGDTKQLLKDLAAAKAAGRLDSAFLTEVSKSIDTLQKTLKEIRDEKSVSKTNRTMATDYIKELDEIKLRFGK